MKEEIQTSRWRKFVKTSLWGVVLFAALLLVDLVTKAVADWYFNKEGNPDTVDIIPGWIWLEITYNQGIAYGIGDNAPAALKIGVILLTAVIMAGVGVFFFKIDERRTLLRIAFVFIVAGGVGNLIDRVYYQVWDPVVIDGRLYGVRDMVNLSRFGFAVCNFADFFITAGAIMLALAMIFFDRDAIYPVGKKYKGLAKEYADAQEKKEKETQVEGQAEEPLENTENERE